VNAAGRSLIVIKGMDTTGFSRVEIQLEPNSDADESSWIPPALAAWWFNFDLTEKNFGGLGFA